MTQIFSIHFFTEVNNFSNANLILGEDWNLVLNDLLDKYGGPPHDNRKSKESLKSYIDFFNLTDVFRIINPKKKVHTRFQSQPYTATKIDFFLISKNLVNNVNSTKINQSIRSDHKIASLIINVNATEWGQEYWKINNDILNDNS